MSLNGSVKVTHFIIGGFDTVERPLLIGVLILITYVVAVLANLLTIVIISYDKRLHKPMYLLICNLAVVDILFITTACTTMLGLLVFGVKTIPYAQCLTQMYIYHVGSVMEMFSITIMAFDRVVAVIFPFQYHSYLTNARTIALTHVTWLSACAIVSVLPTVVVPLHHCHSKLIYSFCDYAAVVRTSCADFNYYFNLTALIVFFLLFFTFSFICLSYFVIVFYVKLSSNNERKKMGATCFSHLIVAACYYCPVFVRAILTRIGVQLTVETRHGLIICAILGPSLVNPFVYCFRTKEIKCVIFRMLKVGNSNF